MSKAHSDPWAEIRHEPVNETLRARRVDATHPHDFFWGLDAKGQRLLLLKLPRGSHSNEIPSINGISLELEQEQFIIRLISSNDTEIFTSLCWSLIDRTRDISVSEELLEVLIAYLFRWQKFLSKLSLGLLTDEERRGLFCELCFLKNQLIPRYGPYSVHYWHGPSGFPQDFALGLTLYEIKSHLSGAPHRVHISSADQLSHSSGVLFLTVYTIGLSHEADSTALSLKQLVNEIRTLLSGPMRDIFEDKLYQQRYTDHPEYEKQHFVISEPDFFKVREGFPRLTTNAIPHGVDQVQYVVELGVCIPFRCQPEWEEILNNHAN